MRSGIVALLLCCLATSWGLRDAGLSTWASIELSFAVFFFVIAIDEFINYRD